MRVLIVYGTTEGQTRKIARFMSDQLEHAGHQVTRADASKSPPSPIGFDAVLIGASVHIHKYQSSVVRYIRRQVDQLNKIPGAFFSVCLAVASDIKEEHVEADRIASHLMERTGWKPLRTIQIAGALKYTEYDLFKRYIMRRISKREGRSTDTSQDYEYTDWKAVKLFVEEFTKSVQLQRVQG